MGLGGYSPIEDYGVIGNCRTAALISKSGRLDWCCFPRFDSPAYFAGILDQKRGGSFSIAPRGTYRCEQGYVEDTNVLATTFTTLTGVVRLLDCFTVASEAVKKGQLWPNHEILRVVEGVTGEVELELRYRPRPNYGHRGIRMAKRGCLGISSSDDRNLLVLQAELPEIALVLRQDELGMETQARFSVRTGESKAFSLIYDNEAPAVIAPLGAEARGRLRETLRYWKEWVARCAYQGCYSASVRRSALALKLLTFAPSGAVIAAMTTSLPENIGGVRNWDYRYCWLRDAALTTRALVSLGFYEEANAFLSWLLHSTRLTWPRLQVLYSVYGEHRLNEIDLPWLEGYARSAPVRVGNAATKQFQLDVYGEVLSAVWQLAEHVDRFDGETRTFILDLGRAVSELWALPDDGIWEVRSGRAQHTHSKVLAWVAMDRVAKLARHFGWSAPLSQYDGVARSLRNAIERQGFSTGLNSYVRTFGSQELDASLLVLPLFGYCDAADPRMLGTCRAICEGLAKNGLIYRYLGVDDGLPGREGSFGICNFWMCENFARAGNVSQAHKWFGALLARDNRLGLWSEEIDAGSSLFLGNYPQGFTHIGLINAAVSLDCCERGEQARAA